MFAWAACRIALPAMVTALAITVARHAMLTLLVAPQQARVHALRVTTALPHQALVQHVPRVNIRRALAMVLKQLCAHPAMLVTRRLVLVRQVQSLAAFVIPVGTLHSLAHQLLQTLLGVHVRQATTTAAVVAVVPNVLRTFTKLRLEMVLVYLSPPVTSHPSTVRRMPIPLPLSP